MGGFPAILSLRDEAAAVAIRAINAETEAWMRKAIEKGPGWNLWRGDARADPSPPDRFAISYEFMLVPPGGACPAGGVLFKQPDLTEGERARVLAGRHDWREAAWEDECGVSGCGHSCCEVHRGEREPIQL